MPENEIPPIPEIPTPSDDFDPSEASGIDSLGEKRNLARGQGFDQIASKIRNIWSGDKGWIETQDFSKIKDPEIWLKITRDPVPNKAINMRLHLVGATDWFLEARQEESKPLIPYMERLIDNIPNFSNARVNSARAVFQGKSLMRMVTAPEPLKAQIDQDKTEKTWWYPYLYHIDPSMFRTEYKHEKVKNVAGEPYDRYKFQLSTCDPLTKQWFIARHPEQYIHMTYMDEQVKAGEGRALLEGLLYYQKIKSEALKMLIQGMERFAFPMMHIGIEEQDFFAKSFGEDEYPTPSEYFTKFMNFFKAMRSGQIMLTSAKDKVLALDFNGPGAQAIIQIIDYVDKAMVELILGSSMPYGSNQQAGSYARAIVEAGSTSSLIRYDRLVLEESYQKLIWALKSYNRANFISTIDPKSGKTLWQLPDPKFKIGREDRDDVTQNAMKLETAFNMGLPIARAEAYRMLQMQPPDELEEVIGGAGTDPEAFRESVKRMVAFSEANNPVNAETQRLAKELDENLEANRRIYKKLADARDEHDKKNGTTPFDNIGPNA